MTTVLKEPAPWFFALLNQAYKLEAAEKLKWISIVAAPHSKSENFRELVSSYQDASRDIIDILDDEEENREYTSPEEIKKAFGGKHG